MKRIAALGLLVCLFLTVGSISALADGASVLMLPLSVKTIEEEAFYGCASLDELRLPAGVESIGARAFAESSLRLIHLPASLTFIDESAFDGPGKVFVIAAEGTYAYTWAEANGYLDDTPGDVVPIDFPVNGIQRLAE